MGVNFMQSSGVGSCAGSVLATSTARLKFEDMAKIID